MNRPQINPSCFIWLFALGYFLLYIPYSGLIKSLSWGLPPGAQGRASGLLLLPSTVLATAVIVPLLISVLGWWKYAGRRELFGRSLPFPGKWAALSGVCAAGIIATTTLAYAFSGISIVFALLLMRGGVLIMSPLIDRLFRRAVRWHSWAACGLSIGAVIVALADTGGYTLTWLAALNLTGYLLGYLGRLNCMTHVAKRPQRAVSIGFFVEEQMVALPVLVSVLALLAVLGVGDGMMDLRAGFTSFLLGDLALAGALAGVFYGGLLVCGSMVYLDARENTFCVPLNRCSSLLSGVVSSLILMAWFDVDLISASHLGAAAVIGGALVVLGLAPLMSGRPTEALLERGVLFICGGNTLRSPLAQAVCASEFARRRLQSGPKGGARLQAQSAGLAAREGAPLAPAARRALAQVSVSGALDHHRAKAVTAEMVQAAGVVLCMTNRHRDAIIRRFGASAQKVRLLNPHGDIEEPNAEDFADVLRCAQQIKRHVARYLGALAPARSTG